MQRVIDYLGDELIKTYVNQWKSEFLLPLIELEGLTFNKEQGNYLSHFIFNGFYFFENEDLIKRAMDLRGEREEIDRIYLTYHYFLGDKNKAIENYSLANGDCQSIFLVIFLNKRFQPFYLENSFDREEYIKELIQEIEEFTQGIQWNSGVSKMSFVSTLYGVINYLKIALPQQDNLVEDLFNISLLKDNPFVELIELLMLLEYPENKEMVQRELDRFLDKDCQEIREYIEIIVNGTPIFNVASINNGILQVANIVRDFENERVGDLSYYNVFTGEKLDINTQYIPSNEQRTYNYFLGYNYKDSNFEGDYALLDSNYNIIQSFGNEISSVLWLDDSKLVYINRRGEKKVFDIEKREFIDYDDSYVKDIKINKESLYSNIVVDGENYGFYTFDFYRYYVVKEIGTNKEVTRYNIDFEFLGNDKDYIYGFEYFANIKILVAFHKETLEKKVLPFYWVNYKIGPQY
ncbi:hypothetical protein [Anaerobranca gottschalkii]|uniref:Uncharacterized protein n=1 Tax=Anaerobranca gottschalkii DSM 13577 TaxID=1120990 RepID=A0A1I0CH74_9FIRM|nr:hypothetical protein [Anaerobranca gottschalkii]SET18860.1 hypothetical protein SAMN03080614_10747 [Anaerobranca gottschalkii DSM 13577]